MAPQSVENGAMDRGGVEVHCTDEQGNGIDEYCKGKAGRWNVLLRTCKDTKRLAKE